MKDALESCLTALVKTLFALELRAEFTRTDAQFGDYATNVALQLSKRLGKPPRAIAERLATKLQEALPQELSAVTVAGPGFLNVTLRDASILQLLTVTPQKTLTGKTVLVEYSDPNPFKPLHAGHLYTTIVGDTIARLVEHAGATTIRINYGGDVGLHVAKSMWAIMQQLGGEFPEKLSEIAEADRPGWLGACYVAGTTAYENDETAKADIIANNRRVYELHAADDHRSAFAQIYWTCRQWSYDYFAQLYRQLEVVPFDRYIPESAVTPLGVKTVEEQLRRGVFQRSDGAVVFNGEKVGLHTRVFINSAGLPTYETKDVGLALTKWNDYHFDGSIIITANEQAQYMQVVLASLKAFAPELAARTKHLTHGLVKLQGGVKISSRKGNGPSALDILEAAHQAGAAHTTHPNEETILAAVKYAFLKNRIGGDIIYDPDESVSLDGNSGPYLQYAYARACSILAKAGEPSASPQPDNLEPGERALVVKLGAYAETVEAATKELLPHTICMYLYELAQIFNRFYEHNRVLDDPRQVLRLRLVQQYAVTLRSGLELLGIAAPEHM